MKKIVLIGCFLLGMSQLIAQVDFDLKTAVDTTQLRIGEQLNYSIQLKSDSILDLTFAEKPIFTPFELLEEVLWIPFKRRTIIFLLKNMH